MVRKSYQEIQVRQQQIDHRVLIWSILARGITFLGISVFYQWTSGAQYELLLPHVFFLICSMLADAVSRFAKEDRSLFRLLDYVELFLFQTLSYRFPRLYCLEYFFAMSIMLDICFSYNRKRAVIQNLCIGLIWMPLMSVSYHSDMSFGINGHMLSMGLQTFNMYGIGVMLLVVISECRYQYLALARLYSNESEINHNLEIMNRSISSSLFSTRTEAEQKAKREITKYVHDNTGYIFTNLIMMMQSTEAVLEVNHDRGMHMLGDSIEYGRSGMNEIRRFLRESQQDSPNRVNIQQEIVGLTNLFQRCTGVTVNVDFWTKAHAARPA